MFQQHEEFAVQLVNDVSSRFTGLGTTPEKQCQITLPCSTQESSSIELTPFAVEAKTADEKQLFNTVHTVDELLSAYTQARQLKPFEEDLAHACDYVSDYATEFLAAIFSHARQRINDEDARRIAEFVSCLDLYTAVKSIESLLNSQADLKLLKIAEVQGWTLHFDHLAIRCGCAEREDAERVVENLCGQHGYLPCQINSENYFQFEDGWDAYVLYKMLENGQQLRLFIDQSSVANSPQIIQHWNYVYGYTAHHLALRATRIIDEHRREVSLLDLISALEHSNIRVMTATGQFTSGLLEQVFTRPQKNSDIPWQIRQHLKKYHASLAASIENGKLLELVSRREMTELLKPAYFALYDIEFDSENPLHSAPVYPYFLPVQAAHVIRTSVQVS
jgi:hypothetical protein